MWLPAVLGEITSRAAICLFDRPRASEREDLDLAGGEPGGAFLAAGDPVSGGGEDGVDGVAVEVAGPDRGPQLAGGVVGASSAARWGRSSRIAW